MSRVPDALRKGLARGDAELAVSGLLQLPVPERGPHLDRVCRLFGDQVARASRDGSSGQLQYWAARAEKEPALCGEGQPALERWWALMWGCARAQDYARARRLFERIQGALAAVPALARSISAYLLASGSPRPEEIDPSLVSRPDDRLGHEPVAACKMPDRPARLEDVEGAVLGACAVGPHAAFARLVEGWWSAGAPEIGRAVAVLAGKLAVRELLLRLAAGGSTGDAAALLVRAVEAHQAPEELETDVRIALRAVWSRAGCRIADEGPARVLCEVGRAAAAYTALRPLVVDGLCGTLFELEASRPALWLIERWPRHPEPRLLDKALRLVALDPRLPSAPGWLEQAMLVAAQAPAPLAAWLARAEPEERSGFLGLAARLLSARSGEALFDALWACSPGLHRDLAEMASVLFGAIQFAFSLSRLERRLRARNPEQELSFDEIADLVGHQLASGPELPKPARALFERIGPRALPFRLDLLEIALHLYEGPAAEEAARRYLEANPDPQRRTEALVTVAGSGHFDLALRLASSLAEELQGDAARLAEALMALQRSGVFPAQALRAFAAAFQEADAAAPAPSTELVVQARRLAGRLCRRRAKPKTSGGARRSSRPRPRPVTDEFPF
jgi:hypothetical protein